MATQPCRYCGKPVEDQYEPEDGSWYNTGYHFGCLHGTGPWEVRNYGGDRGNGRVVRTATTRKRAEELAADYTAWNTPYNGTRYLVVERTPVLDALEALSPQDRAVLARHPEALTDEARQVLDALARLGGPPADDVEWCDYCTRPLGACDYAGLRHS